MSATRCFASRTPPSSPTSPTGSAIADRTAGRATAADRERRQCPRSPGAPRHAARGATVSGIPAVPPRRVADLLRPRPAGAVAAPAAGGPPLHLPARAVRLREVVTDRGGSHRDTRARAPPPR